MNTLERWAADWGVPAHALHDLGVRLAGVPEVMRDDMRTETDVNNAVRLAASQAGCRLWRNNVGAAKMPDGSFLRFGLANESERVNKHIKSGDLIGIRPRIITVADVGSTIGQFVSRESKRPDWKFNPANDREVAQQRWILLLQAFGGDASFTTGGF